MAKSIKGIKAFFWCFPLAVWVNSEHAKAQSSADDWYFEWDWALSLRTTEQTSSVFLPLEETSLQSVDALMDVQIAYQNVTGLFSLYGDGLYQNTPSYQGWGASETELIVRELVWQESWNVAGYDLDTNIGKVRVDWGVGYAYRPLDLFKPYQRLPIGIVVEEGVGVVSVSHYGEHGDWTWIATDSHWVQLDGTPFDEKSAQRGVGARHYRLIGDSEMQGVAYYDDVRRGLLGGSVVGILSPSTAWHSSLLWQARHLAYQIPSSSYESVTLEEQGDAVQALVGVNWANEHGHNVILEYWYDGRSWSQDQWQQAMDRGREFRQQPATLGLSGSYAQGLYHGNLVQHNVMFHWRFDPRSWLSTQAHSLWDGLEDLEPAFDVLYAPQDGGTVTTLWLNYSLFDDGEQSVDLELAARFYNGDSDAVFSQTNQENSMAFKITGKF